MPTPNALLLGTLAGLGLTMIVVGFRHHPPTPTPTVAGRLSRLSRGRGPIQISAGLAVAAVVALATGWLVGGLLAALATWTLPGLLIDADRDRKTRLRRREGIAAWTESLAATLSGAAGLEQTIIATAPTAPAPIRSAVHHLAESLHHGTRLPDALRRLAADLADPVADTVAASLILASTHGAGRLTEPLNLLAAAARDEVAAHRRVDKGRAKAATDARMIILATLAMAVGLVVFNHGYLKPYDTVSGQLVLAVVGALFAVGFRWLHTLSRPTEPPRTLSISSADDTTDRSTGAGPR